MKWAISFFMVLSMLALIQFGASFFGTDLLNTTPNLKKVSKKESHQMAIFEKDHPFFMELKTLEVSSSLRLKKMLTRIAEQNAENREWCKAFLDFLQNKTSELTEATLEQTVDQFFAENSPRIPITLKSEFNRWLREVYPLMEKKRELLSSELNCINEKLEELKGENPENFACLERVIGEYKQNLNNEKKLEEDDLEMQRILLLLESQCSLDTTQAKNLMNELLACGNSGDEETD